MKNHLCFLCCLVVLLIAYGNVVVAQRDSGTIPHKSRAQRIIERGFHSRGCW